MQSMWSIKQNKGSVTIEMTIILPFILCILYLYIMYLLFSISASVDMYHQIAEMYELPVGESEEIQTVDISETHEIAIDFFDLSSYRFEVKFRKNQKNPVNSIRRWKNAMSTIS